MSEFKLIAIKTGGGLTKEQSSIVSAKDWITKENYNYLRNLEPNNTFLFFNDYQLSDDSKFLTHDVNNHIPNLYKLSNNSNVSVEVSAIVGENGSGKSSLIEILYLAIHNLAVQLKVLYDSDKNLVLIPQNYLNCELFVLIDRNTSYKIKFIYNDRNQGCFLFKSKKKNNSFEFNKRPDDFGKEELSKLFYAISVNYSIYGLNSLQIGNWINHLFHKNDSYQTPLVINPMRTRGNFDINKENYLFKYRLLSNSILKYKFSKKDIEIIGNTKIRELIFRLDHAKIEYLEIEIQSWKGIASTPKAKDIQELIDNFKGSYNKKEIINLAVKYILHKVFIPSSKIEYLEEVELYVIKKLYRIAFNYNKYWKYLDYGENARPTIFETNFKKSKFLDFLEALSNDDTHITLKLKQALNYILYNPLRTFKISRNKHASWFETNVTGKVYKIPFNDFANQLIGFSDNIIELLPPSLFNVTINVSEKEIEESYDINLLSSGQLQLIQSVQSSIYHLNNLESYKYSTERNSIKYKNVLIIFDEIELYFHPEYQRNIIRYFLSELDQIKLELIENIHIVYITHSPFVLSDIPHINQLHLEKGKSIPIINKTFAANIYELLQDTFYLKSNIGNYSEQVIDDILNELDLIFALKVSGENVEKLIVYKNKFVENKYLSIINIIGDKIVRNKLLDIYYQCFEEDTTSRKFFLEEQMAKIQLELKKLNR
ncbi:AAA family ATPase [Cellulophaga sp. HaHa_2_1]|uniref:AAA family ATPase n=1 Tax=Cellulophaga sp. HaHa_2_1 TaxID=2749994 RepID=UPI001C4FF969|nr:AAA family ATPase [Cellulophaga sp. HaHa_2_1]QXP52876.1 AAA family ATPase [Cellulophaga sp. HaHa_2_1]